MWPFKRCVPDNANIITVQAPHADPIGGFSWWNIDSAHVREEVELALSQLNTFIAHAIEHYRISNAARIAFGFSQGAGLLSLVAQRQPKRLSAIALLAGFVIESEQVLVPAKEGKLPAIFIAHGSEDQTVTIEKAREGCALLKSRGFEVHMVEDKVTHKIGTQGMRELQAWVASQI